MYSKRLNLINPSKNETLKFHFKIKTKSFLIYLNYLKEMDLKRKFHCEDNEDDLIILNENLNISESKRAHYLSYTERYFKKYYKLDVKYPSNDHLIMMHSNRVAVCFIAPSHPILNKQKYKVRKVDYIQNVNEEMSGKHKHNAKSVNANQPLCKVYCDVLERNENEPEERYFLIYACLNAKLIEINERLIKKPELIQEKPHTEGFFAILMPKLDSISEQLMDLMTHSDYINKNQKSNDLKNGNVIE